jgi:eukaryotic-like serine/threonine-protein kinase
MSGDRPEVPETETLARARRVNAACEDHEAAWRAGQRPRIEDQLEQRPDRDRSELLAELLALEIELRRSVGERPTPQEYLARFSAQGPEIAAAFVARGTRTEGDAGNDQTLSYPAGALGLGPRRAATAGAPTSSLGSVDLGYDFDDFELLEEVARGGMGIVYKARKRSLNCLVALKVIQSGPLASEAEKQRFLLEAEAAANLDHPNIVPVYEIDRVRGLYFTMKWVDGGSLARHVSRLTRDPNEAARVLATVARAVHDAHFHGYLHRDLKPANILLDAHGKPFVIDFGLARRLGEDSGLTQSGAIVGTPSYMAPEQAGGHSKDVGPAADVYSLGAVLYELLAGRPPFRSPSVMETVVQVLERDPTPPGRLRPGVPPELEAVCLKCLEKDPAARYRSAEALAEDLERSLQGGDVEAMRAGPWLRIERWTRREPQLVSRLIGLGAIGTLTQLNYVTDRYADLRLHLEVTGALALWALASVALQAIARRNRWQDSVRLAWAAADVGTLTLILWLLKAVDSSMAVAYPLLVAVSGLWFRVPLVWLATALAEASFGLLALDPWLRGTIWRHDDHHPNIVMAAIAVTGFVVARQVKRLLVLSSYYEHRLPN